MPFVPDKPTRLNLDTRLTRTRRSLMCRWQAIRYYCKLTWLAFCLRPLPHFQPSTLGVPMPKSGTSEC